MAKATLVLAAEWMKWYYDQETQAILFKVGNKVLLDIRDYQTTQHSLALRYQKSFTIVERITLVTFRLDIPTGYKDIHSVFHTSKLQSYTTSSILEQVTTLPKPVQQKGQLKYKVEKILQYRLNWHKNKYLVCWKGYESEENI